MLANVDGGEDRALAVDKVVEAEGQVSRLVHRFVGAVERLNEPFAQADEISADQTPGRMKSWKINF